MVITANEKVLGDRRVPLKVNVDKALEEAKVETVLVAKRTSTVVAMSDHDVDLDEVWLCSEYTHTLLLIAAIYILCGLYYTLYTY